MKEKIAQEMILEEIVDGQTKRIKLIRLNY